MHLLNIAVQGPKWRAITAVAGIRLRIEIKIRVVEHPSEGMQCPAPQEVQAQSAAEKAFDCLAHVKSSMGGGPTMLSRRWILALRDAGDDETTG